MDKRAEILFSFCGWSGGCDRAFYGSLAAYLLSFPQRQRAGVSDGDGGEVFLLYGEDGVHFSQMRICHLHRGGGKIRFGIYACSSEDSSFQARFTHMTLGACQWQAHDGQAPD